MNKQSYFGQIKQAAFEDELDQLTKVAGPWGAVAGKVMGALKSGAGAMKTSFGEAAKIPGAIERHVGAVRTAGHSTLNLTQGTGDYLKRTLKGAAPALGAGALGVGLGAKAVFGGQKKED